MGKFLKRLGTAFRRRLFRLREAEPERKMGGCHNSMLMDLYQRKVVENAINVGDKLPIETLQNCFGTTLNLPELLEKGPLVLKFHRGTWCNFCKADLQYYQKFHQALQAQNATAIAISTELPEKAQEIIEASGFTFHMVADPTTQVAQQFGLLFSVSPEITDAVMDNYGIDLVRYYGKTEIEVALPATYVIGQDGVVLYAFLDEDFRNRANIEEVLHFVRKAAHLNRKRYQESCEERSCVIRDFVKAGCKRVCRHKSSFFHRREKSISSSSSSSSKRRGSVPSTSSSAASISSSEYDRDPLRYCLQNEAFLESFKSYLDKTYCTENLLFFLEAQQFLELEDAERESNATRIFELFIKTGSDLEINVDDTTREKITNSLKKGDVNPEIFAVANKEIYHLMESDSFLKWKKTKEFHRLWEKNGSLDFLSPIPSFAATAA